MEFAMSLYQGWVSTVQVNSIVVVLALTVLGASILTWLHNRT
jgi:hypothetical protein